MTLLTAADAAVTAELQRLADETVGFVAQISRRLAALEPGLSDTRLSPLGQALGRVEVE
jgi:hypothetical protein